MAVGSPRGNPPVVILKGFGPNSALSKRAEVVARAKLLKVMAGIDEELVTQVNQNVQRMLATDRSGYRRKPGTRRLLGSFYAVVDLESDRMSVGLRSRANQKKVAALEFGSPYHLILANDKPLMIQSTGDRRAASIQADGSVVRLERFTGKKTRRQQGAASTRKGSLRNLGEATHHPGNPAYGFMQKAVDEVVRKRLRGKL